MVSLYVILFVVFFFMVKKVTCDAQDEPNE
jgi:hypothetical protein